MSGPTIPSRILHATRGLSQPTAYGKRIDRLSNRIFGEVSFIIPSSNSTGYFSGC